jgi:hypothetical protein
MNANIRTRTLLARALPWLEVGPEDARRLAGEIATHLARLDEAEEIANGEAPCPGLPVAPRFGACSLVAECPWEDCNGCTARLAPSERAGGRP